MEPVTKHSLEVIRPAMCRTPSSQSKLSVTSKSVQKDAEEAPPADHKKTDSSEARSQAHIEEFKRRTGMTPRRCYYLVLLSLMLRLMGGCWLGMVSIEYARYYVINDLGVFDVIRTATGSPQFALQAFLFPFWGVVSDRVSRKQVLAAASVAVCASAWLLTLIPSVEVFVMTKVLALVADVGGPIRDAMLRDIFTAEEWESAAGGVTGLKSRMFLLGQVAFGVATGVGMGLLKLGEYGYGLPNEYTAHKEFCSERHCVVPGHYSWDGPWRIDGCLRVLMIMGSVVLTLDALLVMMFFPETLRPEYRTSGNVWTFIKSSWRELGRPWNNLRVFATPQLRGLIFVRFLGYVAAAGGSAIFLSFYQRFEFDTFTMTVHSVIAGGATWFTTAAMTKIVDRFGDLRGVWVPGNVLILLMGVCCTFLPPGYGYMVYAIWPVFAGPSFAFQGVAPELMSKLIPSDVQGTYQTGKSFVFRLTQAVFLWPWNQLFVHTRHLAYPWDCMPVMVSIGLGVLMLWFTLRLLSKDPKDAIAEGKALDAFWESPYAKGPWYRLHSQGGEARNPTLALPQELELQAEAPGAATPGRFASGVECSPSATGEEAKEYESVGVPKTNRTESHPSIESEVIVEV